MVPLPCLEARESMILKHLEGRGGGTLNYKQVCPVLQEQMQSEAYYSPPLFIPYMLACLYL